jgi:hypothetical protein
MREWHGLLFVAVGVVAMAACGGSTSRSTRSTGSGTASPGGASRATSGCVAAPGIASCYTDTLTISGAVSVHEVSTTTEQQTCASYLLHAAAKNSGRVPLKFVLTDGVAFVATLEGFRGPGLYTLSAAQGNGGSALSFGPEGGVIVGGKTAYTAPVRGTTSTTTATAIAESNGDVRISFSNLADSANPSRTVSGLATLTCKNI